MPQRSTSSIYQTTTARDFFESVRAAATEADRTERQLRRMESAEGVKAQRLTGMPAARGNRDAMAATDRRLDYEARMRDRLEADYALIEEGCAVAYGPDNRGGVDALLGSAYADTIWWRYCAAETWDATARRVGMSPRWCQSAAQQACDLVDALGYDRVKAGEGFAAD